MTASRAIRIAVLHQAVAPPADHERSLQTSQARRLPRFLRGHRLRSHPPPSSPVFSSSDVAIDSQWSFPDTIQGILSAVSPPHNATHLSATRPSSPPILSLSSPPIKANFQKEPSSCRSGSEGYREVGGQAFCNDSLRGRKELEGWFPRSWVLKKGASSTTEEGVEEVKRSLPVVVKPVRGRGRHG
ncbi:hypothetical protein BDY24DRAFT_436101, partial [Mrakia frigida]|uniref:uncharacterized protein n=1 Tax=Mrakia frigida TaxID=29902 RepID=UPI003FCC08F0